MPFNLTTIFIAEENNINHKPVSVSTAFCFDPAKPLYSQPPSKVLEQQAVVLFLFLSTFCFFETQKMNMKQTFRMSAFISSYLNLKAFSEQQKEVQ